MKKLFLKPYRIACAMACALALFTGYVLLDTFVIPKAITTVVQTDVDAASNTAAEEAVQAQAAAAQVTANSYIDENISIAIETVRVNDTTVYIADIQVSDASYLKTALAQNTYGRNIKETTSQMAEENNAIFAINGDYYGFRDGGYVIRNGVLYRSTAQEGSGNEDLALDAEGNLFVIDESEVTAEELSAAGVQQVWSFGPALVVNGEIAVDSNDEVAQSKTSNPRTAIGQVSALHYIVIVSDGRTDESEGLSLYQLAELLAEKGCTVAYNLDGGGSTTMVFNGEVVNNPTNGRSGGEREVSDIVYIGY
ncbi:MAG: phosphodiester glycosidase family protein [Oscillospiraceae bacterium]